MKRMGKKEKKWITAQDVAQAAGVSRAVVSRAFTSGSSVSEEKRKKVMIAAKELGYQVNIIARTMNTGRSNFVGIVTSGFENAFRSKLLVPIVHQLALKGFIAILVNADDPKQLDLSLRELLSYHIAGIIMTSGTPPLYLAEEYVKKEIPVALINRCADLKNADQIICDNYQGAKLAVEHLLSSGGTSFGFIGQSIKNSSTKQRYDAFQEILSQHRLSAQVIFCLKDDYQSGWDGIAELLKQQPLLNSLFCATDILAMGALDYLKIHNLDKQVKVIGFDNIPATAYAAYQLTTIEQNTELLAFHAVELLLKRMKNYHRTKENRIVPVNLVIRKSA